MTSRGAQNRQLQEVEKLVKAVYDKNPKNLKEVLQALGKYKDKKITILELFYRLNEIFQVICRFSKCFAFLCSRSVSDQAGRLLEPLSLTTP
jgi:hypothetical protein